jgi:hypothetical protein
MLESQIYVLSAKLYLMTDFKEPNSMFPPIIKISFGFVEKMIPAYTPL